MRLITFGCSLTYGQYLDDPITQGWPSQLSKKLQIKKVINISEPGASNKKILYNILNYNSWQDDDICVILWTNPYRWTLYKEDGIEDLGAWQNSKAALSFVEHFWNDNDMKLDILEKSSHAARYIPVNSYHMISAFGWLYDPQPDWSCANWIDVDIGHIREQYPKANDNKHPGPLAYKEIARILGEKINESRN